MTLGLPSTTIGTMTTRAPKRNPTVVKLSDDDLRLVKEYAEEKRSSVSGIIRQIVMAHIEREMTKENQQAS